MGKQILTLDNLYQFLLQQNKNFSFNSKDKGKPIVVTTEGYFEAEENEMPGMLKLKLKVCHIDTNRNGSHISKENMETAMPTLKYRPILAYIHELEDGTKDFYAHNMEIVENEDGESEIVYTEKQVGCFTADDPWLEEDTKMGKTYVMAYAVIPENYTEAADIIRRKQGTKVSCELVINDFAYNAKEKYLDLTDFYFGGTTLLGCDESGNEIGEGMLGARADITDFCHKEPVVNYQENSKLIEVLEKLNITLSSLNTQNSEEGGDKNMNKFEELLAKYGKTAEDVTFEIEGLSDEELEAKFAEAFEEDTEGNNEEGTDEDNGDNADEGVDNEDTGDENSDNNSDDDDDDGIAENNACGKKKKKCSIDEEGNMSLSFEISHEDIRSALYNLINTYEEEDNEWYWISDVYDSYFIMENWTGDKLYKQSYEVDGDNVSLSGDRQEVFKMILTESEKIAIDKMREDYAALEAQYNELKAFKDEYDAKELHSQREAVINSEEYAVLANNEDFKSLVSEMDKYSVEDLTVKADLVFAKFAKSQSEFVSKEQKAKGISFNFNEKSSKKKSSPYGNLFTDDNTK